MMIVLLTGSIPLSFEDMPSPKSQIDSGVLPEDVLCRNNMELVERSNGNIACVKESSLFKLLQIGWATKVIPQKDDSSKQEKNPPSGTDTWIPQNTTGTDIWIPQNTTGMGAYLQRPGVVSLQESSRLSVTDSLGFAVGGAQDINNFRENIENNLLPLHTDITYEGLFYDYYFDTGASQECQKLFCPSYSYAISQDPFSKDDDYYLSVGLNSGLTESDFERKKLNLVIVMDISGSMNYRFDGYYYDDPNNLSNGDDDVKTKMEIAKESVVGLVDHLNDDDRLGVVLFSHVAHTSKPLEKIGGTDMEKLQENIMQISAYGGTNMESGMQLGTTLFDEFKNTDITKYENRIIFLTDAMPNFGDTSEGGLLGMIQNNAENHIHTTFIGIGLDLNTELVDSITKVRGANYYSVHSASEFKNRMVEEFEFMVTPLVFNLLLSLDTDGYDIKKVYGSPEADESTGQIMKVNTLFPSKTKDGQTKGGIILLKLTKTSDNAHITLKTSYEDILGQLDGDEVAISIDDNKSDYYENSGIQKGVLLSRYAELMKTWVFAERQSLHDDMPVMKPLFFYDEGIHVPEYVEKIQLGQWERQSVPLQVSDEYEKLITEFNKYFFAEMKSIEDASLEQEMKILNKLENY